MSKSDRPTLSPIEDGSIRVRKRTVLVIVAAIPAAFVSFHTVAGDLVHQDDIKLHQTEAHVIVSPGPDGHDHSRPMADVVADNAKAVAQLPAIRKAVDTANANSLTVKNGFFEERASRLGSRAAEAMPKGTHWKRRKAKADKVKRRAISNLRAGRDVADGLDQWAY